jgi:hypothetical protein
VLVDFTSARVDPDELAAAAVVVPRPFLVGLLVPDEPVPSGADRCGLALSRDLPDSALRLAIEQGLRARRLELEVASLRRDRLRREPIAPPAIGNRVDPDGRVAIHLQTVPDDPNRVRLSLVGRPAQLSTLEREYDPAAGRIGPTSCATRLRPVPGRS